MKHALTILIALSIPALAETTDTSEEGKALDQLRQEFVAAINARDMAKATSYLATDAMMLVQGVPVVVGHDAIRQLGEMIFLSASSVELSMETDRREVSGNLAYEVGRFSLSFTGEGATNAPQQGKFISVWKKGDDDRWRMVVYSPSMNPSMAK